MSKIGALITALKNKNCDGAKAYCEAAKQEYDSIYGQINVQDVKKVTCISAFIDDVSKGIQKGVTKEVNTAWSIILHFHEENKRKSLTKQRKTGTNADEPESKDTEQRYHDSNYANVSAPNPNTSVIRHDTVENTQVEEIVVPEPITKRGVIAIATEFDDLYEHEWLHAYEYLDDKIEEKEKVQILLEIVQKAYQFNVKEAKRQYQEAEKAAKSIVAGPRTESSPVKSDPNSPTGDIELLIRYIYENAHVALPSLLKGFNKEVMIDFENKWKDFFRKKKIKFEIKDKMAKYTDKCVRVTWLLCIEDPPIHMDYGKDGKTGTQELFCKDKYNPFTRIIKDGSSIDYIVWPALMNKNMEGEVLMKGTAQPK